MPIPDGTYSIVPTLDPADVMALADAVNLVLAIDGNNKPASSHTRSAAYIILREYMRKTAQTELGPAALTKAPTVSGQVVTIPNQLISVDGDPLRLSGTASATSDLQIDFSAAASGQYMIVLETWEELVAPTTTLLTFPNTFAGVTNTAGKPDATHFYPNGNVGLGATAESLDSPLVASRLEHQRYLQRQYRVRGITGAFLPDVNLVGTGVNGGTPVYAATPNNLFLVTATTPANGTTVLTDIKYKAVKLCVVIKPVSAGPLVVYTSDQTAPANYVLQGQPPIPFAPDRGALQTLYNAAIGLINQLQAQIAGFSGWVINTPASSGTSWYPVATISPSTTTSPSKLYIEIEGGDGIVGDEQRKDTFILGNILGGTPVYEYIRSGTSARASVAVELYNPASSNDLVAYIRITGGTASITRIRAFGLYVPTTGFIAQPNPVTTAPSGSLVFNSSAASPTIDLQRVTGGYRRFFSTAFSPLNTGGRPAVYRTRSANIADENTVRTVGPTGSGADIIWPALDTIPTTATALTIRAYGQGLAFTGALFIGAAGDTFPSPPTPSYPPLPTYGWISGSTITVSDGYDIGEAQVTITSNRIFEIKFNVGGFGVTPDWKFELFLMGYWQS
jgi:hypothetical protein